MAKGGKLTKLKSVLKKMQSFKLGRPNGTSIGHIASSDDGSFENTTAKDLHPVYVGKSRWLYFITADVMENQLFRELVERSATAKNQTPSGCEVVLFDHLLWMLENADPQPESLDELIEFYACR